MVVARYGRRTRPARTRLDLGQRATLHLGASESATAPASPICLRIRLHR